MQFLLDTLSAISFCSNCTSPSHEIVTIVSRSNDMYPFFSAARRIPSRLFSCSYYIFRDGMSHPQYEYVDSSSYSPLGLSAHCCNQIIPILPNLRPFLSPKTSTIL